MQFFVHGRDRPGALPVKIGRNDEHWDFMDGYADRLVARGPTLSGPGEDAEPSGSLHVVDLPDVAAAERFAFEEPYYRAGAFASVLVCGFRNPSGRTMWDFADAVAGYGRFLVLARGASVPAPAVSRHVVLHGELFDPADGSRLGRAVLLEAPDTDAAAAVLPDVGDGTLEVHHWRFGGRPAG